MPIVLFAPPVSLSLPSSFRRPLFPQHRPRHLSKHRPIARPHSIPNLTLSPPSLASLTPFSDAIRGEWTGFEANFDLQGRPQPVPDYYIPDEFLEWGQIPHGFESTHSIILRDSTLFLKHFRVLPVVSLFGDHVDLEEDLTKLDMLHPGVFVYDDGTFSTGPDKVHERKNRLDKWPLLKFRLCDPREGQRHALHVLLKFDFAKRQMVETLNLVINKWTCIYCDGADIEGSSGFVEGWAVEDAMEAAELAGVWRLEDGAKVEREGGVAPEEAKHVYLPRGVNLAILDAEQGGIAIQVGWLVGDGVRVVVERIYDSQGNLVGGERRVEQKL